MLFAYYRFNPLPPLASNDEIFPAFIVRSLPHGIAGLVIAAIFAAAMSNLSGSLNSLASTSIVDFYAPLSGRSARRSASCCRLSRWLTAAWGIVLIAIALRRARLGLGVHRGPDDRVDRLRADARHVPARAAHPQRHGERRARGHRRLACCDDAVRLFTPLAWTWYVLVGTAIAFAVGYRSVDSAELKFGPDGRRVPPRL